MTICNLVLTPIVAILHFVISVVRSVIETVCTAVTTTLETIVQVAEKVCNWFPWPVNMLCKMVTKAVKVVQTITKTICEDVLKKIVEALELVIEYIIFILHWVCWIIDWILFRWIALLLCLGGVKLRKCLPVCLTILTDEAGKQTISVEEATRLIDASNELLRQCDITIEVNSIRIVEMPDLIHNVPTGIGQLFNWAFGWFSRNVCDCCSGLTIYFVSTLEGGDKGHSIPGSNYLLVAVDSLQDDATIVHEIGHLADMWSHDDEVGNVMSVFSDTPRTKIRELQCCKIGSARFTHVCLH